MLDVRKLALLREVAVHGGITGAAKALHMSPSNVSQQLSRLENEHGIALLEASGRGVRLTPAAERLVERTETVLAILEEAETDLNESRHPGAGIVRLAAFHTFAAGLLGSVVRHLASIAPALELDFVQLDPEAALDEVLSRRADLSVVDEYVGFPLPPTAGLVRLVIGNEPIHAYLPTGTEDPSQVPWAMEPRQSDSFGWARNVCRAEGFEPRVRYESPDPYVHRRLVELGLAAAFLPVTVATGLDAGVRLASELPEGLHRTHTVITRRGTESSPAVVACRAAIDAAFREVVLQAEPGRGPLGAEGSAILNRNAASLDREIV